MKSSFNMMDQKVGPDMFDVFFQLQFVLELGILKRKGIKQPFQGLGIIADGIYPAFVFLHIIPTESVMTGHIFDEKNGSLPFQTIPGMPGVMIQYFL